MPRAFLARKGPNTTTSATFEQEDGLTMRYTSFSNQQHQVPTVVTNAGKVDTLVPNVNLCNVGNISTTLNGGQSRSHCEQSVDLQSASKSSNSSTLNSSEKGCPKTPTPKRRCRSVDGGERLLMREWLERELEKGDIRGFNWRDKDNGIFQIPWLHAAHNGWAMGKDALLFRRWAEHSGKLTEGVESNDSVHKRWKANFRCAINSLPDVKEVKEATNKKGARAIKVYQFLSPVEHRKTPRKVSTGQNVPIDLSMHKVIRRRKKLENKTNKNQKNVGRKKTDCQAVTSVVPECKPQESPVVSGIDFQLGANRIMTDVPANLISVSSLKHGSGSVMSPVLTSLVREHKKGSLSSAGINSSELVRRKLVIKLNSDTGSEKERQAPVTHVVNVVKDCPTYCDSPDMSDTEGKLVIDEGQSGFRCLKKIVFTDRNSNNTNIRSKCHQNGGHASEGKLIIDVPPEGRSISVWRERPSKESGNQDVGSECKNKHAQCPAENMSGVQQHEEVDPEKFFPGTKVTSIVTSAIGDASHTESKAGCYTEAKPHVRFIPEKQGSLVIQTEANFVRCSVDKTMPGSPSRPTSIKIIQNNRSLPQPWDLKCPKFSDYVETMERLVSPTVEKQPPLENDCSQGHVQVNMPVVEKQRRVTNIINITPAVSSLSQDVGMFSHLESLSCSPFQSRMHEENVNNDAQSLNADICVPLDLACKSSRKREYAVAIEPALDDGQLVHDKGSDKGPSHVGMTHGIEEYKAGCNMSDSRHAEACFKHNSNGDSLRHLITMVERNSNSLSSSTVTPNSAPRSTSAPTEPKGTMETHIQRGTGPIITSRTQEKYDISVAQTQICPESTLENTVKKVCEGTEIEVAPSREISPLSNECIKVEGSKIKFVALGEIRTLAPCIKSEDEHEVDGTLSGDKGEDKPHIKMEVMSDSGNEEDTECEPDVRVAYPKGSTNVEEKQTRVSFTLPNKKRSPVIITGKQVKRNAKLAKLRKELIQTRVHGDPHHGKSVEEQEHRTSLNSPKGSLVLGTAAVTADHCYTLDVHNQTVTKLTRGRHEGEVGNESIPSTSQNHDDPMVIITSQNPDGSFSRTFLCLDCQKNYMRRNMVMRRLAEEMSSEELCCHICKKPFNGVS